ncbi:MAG TPA: hypothetical protein VFN02_04165, partial [Ktedonobacteraceae bacterium]|nr:hypothetical protein [Ktedonobacteraceae bacterium]
GNSHHRKAWTRIRDEECGCPLSVLARPTVTIWVKETSEQVNAFGHTDAPLSGRVCQRWLRRARDEELSLSRRVQEWRAS